MFEASAFGGIITSMKIKMLFVQIWNLRDVHRSQMGIHRYQKLESLTEAKNLGQSTTLRTGEEYRHWTFEGRSSGNIFDYIIIIEVRFPQATVIKFNCFYAFTLVYMPSIVLYIIALPLIIFDVQFTFSINIELFRISVNWLMNYKGRCKLSIFHCLLATGIL